MNAPHPLRRQSEYDPERIARRSATLARTSAPTRSYDVAWLGSDGTARYDTVRAPAHPVVEAACANLARGAEVMTADGRTPVEDLTPGMRVITSEYGPVTLQWIGAVTLAPGQGQGTDGGKLIRVMADTLGLGKPAADLMLSSRSHVLVRQAACKEIFGIEQAYAPIRAYEDGVQVIALAARSPVTLYNLAFDRQATITANGVEVETFHPGPLKDALFEDEVRSAMLRLFPHIGSFSDFGPALTQRLTTFELRRVREGG